MLNEAILLEQNKRLREENDELRETVRQLRADVEAADVELPGWLPHLTPRQADILRLLCKRDLVTSETMLAVLYADEDRISNLLSIFVHQLRGKLRPLGIQIENVWGRGYRLTAPSKARLVKKSLTSDMQDVAA